MDCEPSPNSSDVPMTPRRPRPPSDGTPDVGPPGGELPADYYGEAWSNDQRARLEPPALTAWFRSAVPILDHLDWRVSRTERGFAETLLPLNTQGSNQYIAHQAAVILIAADYTGGIALGTLLHDIPVVGIHPQPTDYGAYLWGARAEIKWIRPSVGDLTCTAQIAPEQHRRILRRFLQGRRVLQAVPVQMWNGPELVAEAVVTYWVQDTHALRRHASEEAKIHILYDHKLKTSARLIAGLRALEQERPQSERLFDDPLVPEVAGVHGVTLARRFLEVAPQLQAMMAARTRHVDDLIADFHRGARCQVVNIGAGLDTREARVALPPGSTIFQLDLPAMLTERAQAIGPVAGVSAVGLSIDLREEDVADVLAASPQFATQAPTIVVWEGGSMYFDETTVSRILGAIGRVLAPNAASRLWLDYVKPSAFDGTNDSKVLGDFNDAMQRLGEPFICGFEDVRGTMANFGMNVQLDVASDLFAPSDDPIFGLYRFCLASRA